jgi:hypothetical protein
MERLGAWKLFPSRIFIWCLKEEMMRNDTENRESDYLWLKGYINEFPFFRSRSFRSHRLVLANTAGSWDM